MFATSYPRAVLLILVASIATSPLSAETRPPLVYGWEKETTSWRAYGEAAATLSKDEANEGSQSLKVAIRFPENEENPQHFYGVVVASNMVPTPGVPVAVEVDISAFWVNPPPTSPQGHFGTYAKPFLVLDGRLFGYQEVEAKGSERSRALPPRGKWRTYRFEFPPDVIKAISDPSAAKVPFVIGLGLSAGIWGDSPVKSLSAAQSGMVLYFDNLRIHFQ